jgi:uncharacterized protein (UPF0262 family)
VPLEEVRIDDRTWRDADDARRHEYRLAIQEVLGDETLSFPEDARTLSVTVAQQGIALALLSGAGEPIAQTEVPRSVLSPHVAEYVDIVRQLEKAQRGGGSTSVEALDMAKKLAHDDAARTLRRLCRPLSADHDTCRRIWTLLLTLRVDTTRLTGVRGHRPVR